MWCILLGPNRLAYIVKVPWVGGTQHGYYGESRLDDVNDNVIVELAKEFGDGFGAFLLHCVVHIEAVAPVLVGEAHG